jgi:alpha-tubulin suppressor-like RCC1 family protein
MMVNSWGVPLRMRRTAVLSAALIAVPLMAGPASAGSRTTHVSATASPSTVLVGGAVVVSGLVTPVEAGSSVALQLADGKSWRTLAHQKSTSAGTFAFHLKAPRTATTWHLRVSRAAVSGNKSGVSATRQLHVVRTAFAVTASAALGTSPGTVVVTGKAGPHATGKVTLQRLSAGAWIAVAPGTLSRTGGFIVTASLAAGASYKLRVVKPFTRATAQGVSKTLTIAIPPPPPVISAAALPKAVIGRAFATTLSASLGTAPYTWSATGLPSGITVTAAGVVSGTSLVAGSYPVLLSLTDAAGQKAYAISTLVVQQTSLRAWGYNYSGQIGDGSFTNQHSPVPVGLLNAVTTVSGNGNAVLAVRVDGSLWAWGANDVGSLGLPSVIQTPLPTPVPGISSVTAVASGQTTGYALTSDGTVWASGNNAVGQLGDGTTTRTRSFAPVPGLGKAKAIAAAVGTAYALLQDGTVWAWGDNGTGQLGDGVTGGFSTVAVRVVGITGATALASAGAGAYVLLADGTVRTWGSGRHGALGNGATTDSAVPVSPVGLSNVRALATNQTTDDYVIKSDGTVWAWGDNTQGTIGDATQTDRLVPTQVPGAAGAVSIGGFGSAYAVMPDGSMRAWGENSNGALGLGDEVNRLVPTQVPGLSGVVYTAGSEATGFAVVASG